MEATSETLTGTDTIEERRVARPKGRVDRVLERADERPKPPWHPVPLVELSVLAGIVIAVVGMFRYDTENGRVAVVVGMLIASIAGLDTAAREHFAGYRSHSALLAGLPAIGSLVVVSVFGLPVYVGLLIAAAVFGVLFFVARRAFRKRTGVAFKV